jgi:hypothetical protein
MFNQYDSVENRNTKGAIKPTPAEILKGNPLIHKIILPTAESGIAEYTIKASFIDPKAKYNKIKIKNNARGTATINLALAL